jgi:DNA-directed RNA polymerase specialized sigma24 family protein
VATRAEREAQRLTRESEELRRELELRRDRSREALAQEARQLQAERGWGASEIGRHLGWSESTIRSWLQTARTASAAD